MSTQKTIMILCALAGMMLLLVQDCPAARGGGGGGGGGARGGGGFSGGGSVRFAGNGGGSSSFTSRPSTPSYSSRPSSPAYSSRPSTPAPRPAAPASRPATQPAGTSRPAYNNGVGTTYRPANMGTISTRPASSTPAGGHVVQGPGGGSWGAAQGPGGGMMVGHQNPGGGGSIAGVGPGGGAGGVVVGPGGGMAGRVTGPRGGSAAGIRGPQEGAAGVVRGPAGGAVGGVRGTGGAEVAGARTRYGGAAAVARLPDGSTRVAWRGGDYWYAHGSWYQPYWHDDDIWYWPCYAPVGYFTTTIDCGDSVAQSVNINGVNYYQCQNVYYTQTTQNGQAGYAVAENPVLPAASAEPNTPDPFACLSDGLNFLGTQKQFDMTVSDVYDEITAGGQKVSYNSRRNVFVRRPDKVAIEYRGGGQDRRTVLSDGICTILDRTTHTYSQTPVPPTIDGAMDTLADKYGLVVVVGELLHTDLYKKVSEKIVSGQYLGQDQTTGYNCDHLAFTTEDADYEFWFDAGASPVIRRLSIVYSAAPGRPRYTMLMNRINAAAVPDSAFAVRIPSGASLVTLGSPPAASQPTTQPPQ